jgi:hypothetical protein
MQNYCLRCGSTTFRPSHFRPFDFMRLLRFEYPIRCVNCHDRSFVPITLALSYRRKKPASPSTNRSLRQQIVCDHQFGRLAGG